MKQKLLLIVFTAILGVGGYWFLRKKESTQVSLKDFISDNTLILLETNEFSLENNKTLSRIPFLSQITSQYQVFNKIGFTDDEIKKVLSNKNLFFAIVPDGNNSLSTINYLKLIPDNEGFINKINVLNQNTTGNRIIPHTTNGYKISEVIDENAKPIFSYLFKDNLFIFSKTTLVLEESILQSSKDWVKSLPIKPGIVDSTFTKTYINKKSVESFLNTISSDNKLTQNHLSELLADNYQWLNPQKNAIEGINSQNNSELFKDQKPSKISCFHLVPTTCSYLVNLSFSNSDEFAQHIILEPKIESLRDKAESKFDFDYKKLFSHIQGEITLCSFDNFEQRTNNKILIIKQKDLLKPLQVIARNVVEDSENDVLSIQYGSFLITSLGIREFPKLLLGSQFGGFEECYFTEYNGYIILASSLLMMQDYLINISKGNVWNNSPKNKIIIKNCIPSNLTFIVENSKAMTGVMSLLNDNWNEIVEKNQIELNKVQSSIIQQNEQEGRFVLLNDIEPNAAIQKNSNKWIKLGGFPVDLSNEPLYLINPITKNAEILVQNKSKQLILFSNGKRIWNYSLGGKIVGQITNVQFSKTNTQQLLVVTSSNVFVLTRTEKGFDVKKGKSFKNFDFEGFNVFENEIDKNKYLTLISTNGESFKIDKTDLSMNRLNVNDPQEEYLFPLPSVIVKGTEYAILLDKTGKLKLQDAHNKVLSGFPINIKGNFNSTPIIEGEGQYISIRIVSESGELFKLNLEGKIVEKKQLYRPNNEVKFSLATDERNTDWVLMRTDGKQVVVIDKSDKEIFTINSAIYGKKVLFYYNLGIAGKYFALNNGYETYRFYDADGKILGNVPVESNSPPSLSYADSYRKVIMNITKPSGIETWSVKLK
jgi:hypothetical protein